MPRLAMQEIRSLEDGLISVNITKEEDCGEVNT